MPDFPSPGILFKDITPLLRDARGLATAVKYFSQVSDTFDVVAGVEARGFIFASAVAQLMGKGFVPIRKSGKLPAASYSQSYALEYGEATLQIHQDAIIRGERVLLIDDVLATGGTLIAASALINQCEASVDKVAVLMEIDGLKGRSRYAEAAPSTPIAILL